MALLFIEGFETFNPDQAAPAVGRWYNADADIVATAGPHGGTAIQFDANADDPWVTGPIPGSPATVIVGFAVKPTGTQNYVMVEFLDRDFTDHVCITCDSGGTVYAKRGSWNGTTLLTSTVNLTVDAWNYLEVKLTIHGSTGAVAFQIDGVDAGSASTLDTADTANLEVARVCFGHWTTNASKTMHISNIYICDDSGANNNDFLGECRVDAFFPTSDGAHTDFTLSTGVNHYALVDETDPNDDTDYIYSSTANHKDTFGFGDMTHNPATIHGVQVNAVCSKEDAAARNFRALARPVTTDYNGDTQRASATYNFSSYVWDLNPQTSAAWTETLFNASEFGIEIL